MIQSIASYIEAIQQVGSTQASRTPYLEYAAVVISILAAVVSFFSYRTSRKRGRLERAVEESRIYAIVLNDTSIICQMVNKTDNVRQLVERNKPSETCQFTRKELEERYTLEECRKLESFFTFQPADTSLMMSIYLMEHAKDFIVASVDGSAEKTDIRMSADSLKAYYVNKMVSMLNALESFAMTFNSELADSTLVFQSLHQSFFSVVQALYFPISVRNEEDSEKYYTNIIALYRKWLRLDAKIKKKLDVEKTRAQKKRSRIQRKKTELEKQEQSISETDKTTTTKPKM